MSVRPPLAPLAALCAAAASIVLVACGGSAPKAAATQENEAQLVKFAKCMREHGINVAPGSSSGGPSSGQRLLFQAHNVSPQQMEAAQSACNRYRPAAEHPNLTPQEKVEREEAVLKFAKCMREHGVNIHASASGGEVRIGIEAHPGGGGPNPESPSFQAAQKACQGLLPFKGGGPGGPGGGPATNTGGKSGSGFGIAAGG